jgi:hypothetical protein
MIQKDQGQASAFCKDNPDFRSLQTSLNPEIDADNFAVGRLSGLRLCSQDSLIQGVMIRAGGG